MHFALRVKFNPILDWAKNLLFRNDNFKLKVERPEKFGGNTTFKSYEELENIFSQKKLHPMDLKKAISREIIKLLEPARKHFEQPKIKKMKEEMDRLIATR
jgi:tyrosyl-tRNA synthetase